MASLTVPVESYTDEERERLAPHFTNLDRPVFGLVNLPETVKGALFARYSRYPGTLRRLEGRAIERARCCDVPCLHISVIVAAGAGGL